MRVPLVMFVFSLFVYAVLFDAKIDAAPSSDSFNSSVAVEYTLTEIDTCPDRAWFVLELEAELGQKVVEPVDLAKHQMRVDVIRKNSVFVASYVLDQQKKKNFRSTSCEEALRTLILSAVVFLDPIVRPKITPQKGNDLLKETTRGSLTQTATTTLFLKPKEKDDSNLFTRPTLVLSGVFGSGFSPGVTGGGRLGGSVGFLQTMRLGLEIGLFAPTPIRLPSNERVESFFTDLTLFPCVEYDRFTICALVRGGLLRVFGESLEGSKPQTPASLFLGFRPLFRLFEVQAGRLPVRFHGFVESTWALKRVDVQVNEETVWTSPLVGLSGGLLLEAMFGG